MDVESNPSPGPDQTIHPSPHRSQRTPCPGPSPYSAPGDVLLTTDGHHHDSHSSSHPFLEILYNSYSHLESNILALHSWCQSLQRENDSLKERVGFLSHKCETAEWQYEELCAWQDHFSSIAGEHDASLDRLESSSKRNNVRFFNVDDNPHEDFTTSARKVVQLLNRFYPCKLWRLADIENAYRLGPGRYNQRPRTLVAQLHTWHDKMSILRHRDCRAEMANTLDIRVAGDLTFRQQRELQFHKENGRTAYFRNGMVFFKESRSRNSRHSRSSERDFSHHTEQTPSPRRDQSPPPPLHPSPPPLSTPPPETTQRSLAQTSSCHSLPSHIETTDHTSPNASHPPQPAAHHETSAKTPLDFHDMEAFPSLGRQNTPSDQMSQHRQHDLTSLQHPPLEDHGGREEKELNTLPADPGTQHSDVDVRQPCRPSPSRESSPPRPTAGTSSENVETEQDHSGPHCVEPQNISEGGIRFPESADGRKDIQANEIAPAAAPCTSSGSADTVESQTETFTEGGDRFQESADGPSDQQRNASDAAPPHTSICLDDVESQTPCCRNRLKAVSSKQLSLSLENEHTPPRRPLRRTTAVCRQTQLTDTFTPKGVKRASANRPGNKSKHKNTS